MAEFLQGYGVWIFAGLLLLFMFTRRGHGGCCGGTGGGPEKSGEKPDPVLPRKDSSGG